MWLFGLISSVFLAAACSAQDAKTTFDYLNQEREILQQAKQGLRNHPVAKAPRAPIFTRQTTHKDRLTATKKYRQETAEYLTNLIELSTDSEKLANQVQNKLSSVNGVGVDQQAIHLVTLHEQILGDLAQVCFKLRFWATREESNLHKTHSRDPVLPDFVLGIVKIAYGSPMGFVQIGKGMSEQGEINRKKAAEQSRRDDLLSALEDARIKLESDKAELVTARNQLVTTFAARYPDYSWSTMFAE